MAEEKPKKLSLNQVRQTFTTSWRLVTLVWKLDRGLFTGTIISTLIPGAIPFVNAYIYKLIIDEVVAVVGGAALNYQYLYLLLGARVVSYFLQSAAFQAQDYIERLLWTKVPIKINELILEKTSQMDIYYYENSRFKDLLEKVRDSYHYQPQNLISNIVFMLQSLLQTLIAFVALAYLNVYLLIIVALVVIPEFIIQSAQSKLSWGIWSDNTPYRKRFWYLSGILQDAKSIKELKIFQLSRRFLNEIKSVQEKFYEDNKRIARKNFFLNLGYNGFSTLVFIGIEIYIIWQALLRQVTIGDINFYTSVTNNFQMGLGGLLRNINKIFESSLYVQSIFEVLDAKPVIILPEHPKQLKIKTAPTIEFRNVSFTYPESKTAILKDFSLIIEPGDKIAFVGENGAGKSTIIKLLARFYDVDQGQILINGIDIKELDLDEWYRYFGVLFQDFNRYEHTAKENIEFGRSFEKLDIDKVTEAAKESGAHQVIKKLEKGYDQMLGKTFENGVDLSVGQWQKVALARAFLRDAPVLVLDEPTASIDAKAESEIFARVEKLSKDKTVIIISHRFSTVRNADKIFVIDEGRIVEQGSHQDLMKIDGQYAKLFRLQAKGYQ